MGDNLPTRPGINTPVIRSFGRRKLRWVSIIGGVILVLAVVTAAILHMRSDDQAEQATYTAVIQNAEDLGAKGQASQAAEYLKAFAATTTDEYQKAYAQTLAGAIYERNGDLEKARDAYLDGKDLPAKEGGLAANEGLGRIEGKLGNKEQAISYWRKCLALKQSEADSPLKEQDIINYERYITALGGKI